MVGTAGCIGQSELRALATLKKRHGRRRPGTWQNALRRSAVSFANCELDVFIEVHMDDLQADPSEPLT